MRILGHIEVQLQDVIIRPVLDVQTTGQRRLARGNHVHVACLGHTFAIFRRCSRGKYPSNFGGRHGSSYQDGVGIRRVIVVRVEHHQAGNHISGAISILAPPVDFVTKARGPRCFDSVNAARPPKGTDTLAISILPSLKTSAHLFRLLYRESAPKYRLDGQLAQIILVADGDTGPFGDNIY